MYRSKYEYKHNWRKIKVLKNTDATYMYNFFYSIEGVGCTKTVQLIICKPDKGRIYTAFLKCCQE